MKIMSCQTRVTVTSYFVYKVIWDLKSIDHLCINPILDEINTQVIYLFALFKLLLYLTIVNKILRQCHSWLARQ